MVDSSSTENGILLCFGVFLLYEERRSDISVSSLSRFTALSVAESSLYRNHHIFLLWVLLLSAVGVWGGFWLIIPPFTESEDCCGGKDVVVPSLMTLVLYPMICGGIWCIEGEGSSMYDSFGYVFYGLIVLNLITVPFVFQWFGCYVLWEFALLFGAIAFMGNLLFPLLKMNLFKDKTRRRKQEQRIIIVFPQSLISLLLVMSTLFYCSFYMVFGEFETDIVFVAFPIW